MIRRAVLDQTHLRRGPAHVERDDPIEPGEACEKRGRHGASRRTRFDQADRKFPRLLHGRDAAARQHDVEPARKADGAELCFQPVEIAAHQRLHIRVGAGRAGALELADFGRDLRRERQRKVRIDAANDAGGAPLVRGIAIGMQERDRNRLDAVALDHLPRRRHHCGLVQRHEHLPLEIHTLPDFAAPIAWHERRRRFEKQIVEVVTCFAPHLDHIAKALGGDQADGRAGPLDHRVGDQRGAVHDAVQIGGVEIRLLQQAIDAGDDRLARIVRCRQQLAGVDEIAPRIVQHEVGERAADIDADANSAPGHRYFAPYCVRAACGVT